MENKIISFSLWGKPKYVQGAIENLKLQPKIYPGWKCRFYIDETLEQTFKPYEDDAEIVIMPKSDGNYGLFWRFEALKDETIDRFVVRDTDSRINIREADAVKEWEESGKEFHIMRDNKQHRVYICGGMWGATKEFIDKIKFEYDNLLTNFLRQLSFNDLYGERGKYFNVDQLFLWKHIWPRIINSHIAHIRKDCNLEITKNEKYFKVEIPGFIGEKIEI